MTLNITPCKNIVSTGGQDAQIVGELDTEASINISADSTGTAFPKLTGGNNEADYYMISSDVATKILIQDTQAKAATVTSSIGTTIQAGATIFIGRQQAKGWIAKADI